MNLYEIISFFFLRLLSEYIQDIKLLHHSEDVSDPFAYTCAISPKVLSDDTYWKKIQPTLLNPSYDLPALDCKNKLTYFLFLILYIFNNFNYRGKVWQNGVLMALAI